MLVIGDSIVRNILGALDQEKHGVISWPGCTMKKANSLLSAFKTEADVVALSFGGNDLKPSQEPALILPYARDLLKTAKKQFSLSEVHLLSILPRKAFAEDFLKEANDVLSQACALENCAFTDFSNSFESAHFQEDGVHLTNNGALRLAECILNLVDSAPDSNCAAWLTSPSEAANEEDGTIEVAAFWVPKRRPQWSFEEHARLYVDAMIGGVSMEALLDGGASHCHLPSSIIPLLQSKGIKIEPASQSVFMGDGRPSVVAGKATIPVNLGGKTWTGEFFFLDSLPYEAILGIDCLRGLRMVIDYETPKITVRNSLGINEVPIIHLCCSGPQPEDVSSPKHPALSEDEYSQFDRFLDKWKADFISSPGRTSKMTHTIYLEPGTVPVRQRSYPCSPYVAEVINAEIDSLLDKGLIEPSISPWCSPLIVVPKKNGEKRVCVDFRVLNARTLKNSYPLPFLQEVLDSLKDSNIVSTIDLKSGFHQIPLSLESKAMTAFSAPGGKGFFQFTVMPFGLTNAPATFQNLMNVVLQPVMKKGNVRVYMDDLVVSSNTFEQHLEILNEVFSLLLEAGLTINWKKSHFLQAEIEYLGHIVGQGQLKASPGKISAVVDMPPPSNQKQVKSFIGACAWFKRFIPSFSTVCEPLTRLLKKNQPWNWGDEQKAAFQDLKQCLTTSPILRCPDFSLPFTIETDASNVGLGAVLKQVAGSETYVVAYASRTLNSAERDLATTHKELLGVLFGVEKFRPYVEGCKFLLITDHSALTWLLSLKNPMGKFARWILRLSQFDFDVQHREGRSLAVSDCLSRTPYFSENTAMQLSALEINLADFKDAKHGMLLKNVSDRPEAYPSFRILDGLLYKKVYKPTSSGRTLLLVVPQDFRQLVMNRLHGDPTSGHFGFKKTLERIRCDYYWPNMFVEVRQFVAKCLECQKFKAPNTAPCGGMSDEPPSLKPMSIVSCDLIGPLPRSKQQNRFAVVLQDTATKYVTAIPVRSATSKAVIKVFKNDWVFLHGPPDILLTDNGPAFISKELKEVCEAFGVKQHFAPRYFPRANAVERVNRTLKTSIAIFAHSDHRNWDSHLREFSFAINTIPSESTSLSPARLVFGRELRPCFTLLPSPTDSGVTDFDAAVYDSEVQRELALSYGKALASLRKAKEQQARAYNLRHRGVTFRVDDLVLRRNFALSQGADGVAAKLLPKFIGPFRIGKVLSPTQFQLINLRGDDAGRWAADHLKHFNG